MTQVDVRQPASGDVLYSIKEGQAHDVKPIFTKAQAAKLTLKNTTAEQRAAVIAKVVRFLAQERQWLIQQVMDETGRCRMDVLLSDLLQMLEDADWLAKRAPELLADKKVKNPLTLVGKSSCIYQEPRGIVLVISPWNLPLQIGLLAALTAFAAGNAVILKPSEETPVQAVWQRLLGLDPLLQESLQVVYGSGATAQQLIAQRPDMIAFTGSVKTGKKILAQAADMVIPVVMELGAKDFMIVFDDAELERTVAASVWGAMHNTGQSCTSVERLYLQEGIATAFITKAVATVKELSLSRADGDDKGDKDVGGMITQAQMETVKRHVADAREKGATIHCGGEPVEGSPNLFQPTVISGVRDDMAIHQEETFGPIMVIYTFVSEAEAVAAHNASDYGLSASVWTADRPRAERMARALEVGCVCINEVMITEANPELPFGGVKYSGFGRAKGEEGLLGFTRSKSVLYSPMSQEKEPNWYPYTEKKFRLLNDLVAASYLKGGLARLWGMCKSLYGLKFKV